MTQLTTPIGLIGAAVLVAWLWVTPRPLELRMPTPTGRRRLTPSLLGRVLPSGGGPAAAIARPAAGFVVAVLLGASWFTAALLGGLVWLGPELRRRSAAATALMQRRAALPEVLELISLGLGAGGTLGGALRLVASAGPVVTRTAFARTVKLTDSGETRRDALAELTRSLGPDYRPLVDLLLSSDRNGARIGDILERLGRESTAASRRHADEQARRTPVRMLAPLVLCSLPAVLVGTVVPLIILAVGNLELPGG